MHKLGVEKQTWALCNFNAILKVWRASWEKNEMELYQKYFHSVLLLMRRRK